MKQIINVITHLIVAFFTWAYTKAKSLVFFLFGLITKLFSWMKNHILKLFSLVLAFVKKVYGWIIGLPKLMRTYYFKTSHWLNWKKKIWALKFYPAMLTASYIVKRILLGVGCLLSFCFIIAKAELFTIDNQTIHFANTVASISSNSALSVLGTQISITLVCLSITSLIANSEKKYIMGERATNLAFPAKGVFSFKVILSFIFILLFANLLFILEGKPIGLILLVFISSTYLTAFTIYRYALVLLSQHSQKNKLYAQYYHENLKHLAKYKPIEPHIQPKMLRYKNVVLSQIANKELDLYKENIEFHFSILRNVFFNHKKEAQNYYTEHGSAYDIAGHITSFIDKLLNEGLYQDSIGYLNNLLSQYNFYRIINVGNDRLRALPSEHIQIVKAIPTESELQDYVYAVLRMIDLVHYQTYLFTTEDLSYCRIAEVGIYLHPSNRSYEKLYTSIKENPHLQDYEKSRVYELLFDQIRMTEHYEEFPLANVNDLVAKRMHHPEKEHFPFEIKGEPIAILFLSFLEHHDYENIHYFSQMNISDTLKQFIFTLVSLSVINITHLNNKRVYYLDIDIDIDGTQKALQHSKLCSFSIDSAGFKKLYTFILEHYTAHDNDPKTMVSGSVYFFTPRFRFLKKIVDAFFYELALENNLKESFLEENPNYVSDPSLCALIQSFKSEGSQSCPNIKKET